MGLEAGKFDSKVPDSQVVYLNRHHTDVPLHNFYMQNGSLSCSDLTWIQLYLQPIAN